MGTTKITARIYEPLWLAFMKQANALFLKRDAFLNHVISRETPHLSKDLNGKRLSQKAKRYIARALKSMGNRQPRPVNIVVDQDTADALNEVVGRCNLVRDTFINRLIMLLRSSDSLLGHFDIPKTVNDRSFGSAEPMPTSPMKALEVVRDDPLFYLRVFAANHLRCGLYLLPMPKQLTGFSCYLEDNQVPQTAAYAKKQAEKEELMALLEPLESSAFTLPSTKTNEIRK